MCAYRFRYFYITIRKTYEKCGIEISSLNSVNSKLYQTYTDTKLK